MFEISTNIAAKKNIGGGAHTMTWFLIMIVMLLLLVGLGVPIALAVGFPALVVLLITGIPSEIVPLTVFNATLIFPLLAIPLFMFAGLVMEKAEIADALMDFASALVGWLKGDCSEHMVLYNAYSRQ